MSISDVMLSTRVLRVVVLACAGATAGMLSYTLAQVAPIPAPRLGLRGKRRERARASQAFALVEPIASAVGGWLRMLPLGGLCSRLEPQLRVAGYMAGLCAEELLALSLLSGLGVGLTILMLTPRLESTSAYAPVLALLGAALPLLRVRVTAALRRKALERSLPNAMDLCALCMSAGADFPAALSWVVRELGTLDAVCREELSAVLAELELGRTRVEALMALASRTSSRAVREFVAAVCQSEQKGTPLIDALEIQAMGLRRLRSVRAEELAASAGVKLMLPLLLMVGSLMLVVFGPFLVNGMGF